MMEDEDDVIATVTYCTYGQCADRTVPCEACTVIEVKGDEDELLFRTSEAAARLSRNQ